MWHAYFINSGDQFCSIWFNLTIFVLGNDVLVIH